jgi:hypothetical protein
LNPQRRLKALLKKEPTTDAPKRKRIKPRVVVAQRRLTAGEVDDLIEVYKAGATVPQVVEQFGIHRTTVLAHLERRDVPRRPETRKLTGEQVADAGKLYASGLSTVKVGAIYGVDAETIRKAFIRSGLKLRPRRGTPAQT